MKLKQDNHNPKKDVIISNKLFEKVFECPSTYFIAQIVTFNDHFYSKEKQAKIKKTPDET